MNVFTVTCDQFNAYLLNKIITFFLFISFPVLFLALINLNLICNMGCLIMLIIKKNILKHTANIVKTNMEIYIFKDIAQP